ncbi:nickel pincer cofactor biosynthesis protein LarB [Telmatospirillum sp. J64-1]|uniref:nickel pincer cofactor biosynthesis protein LarB n=1 Tax=Telmatospirillum sp. J64-1 TaxID=2502183 RepID=UPI00115E5CFF|nr:nickel pincer cofactor biosynthesis protein LarB [Telmatospirillum sp. J64-1]
MTPAKMDWERVKRTGLPEAVYGEGKSLSQLAAILADAAETGRRLLVTRLTPERFQALPEELKVRLDYDEESRTAILGEAVIASHGIVTIVTAGLADMPVAGEVARTLAFSGVEARCVADVGVAGLWRLMDSLSEIREAEVVIAVAGMEGALFSVLAGLVAAPIIAVPTSVGRGVTEGGHVALHSALGSCAPGLLTVNIDNGFGAAQAALRILQRGRM